MSSPKITTAAQILSITTSLIATGGIAALSLFDVPEYKAQPASRSLPSIRWMFSRGSHIFPQAAGLASAGFAYLAYTALPKSSVPFIQRLSHGRVPGYILASVLVISIGPWTRFAMIPTNFRLIEINSQKGGARSKSSTTASGSDARDRKAEDSVEGMDEASEFKDTSGPQEQTKDRDFSPEEQKEVDELLEKFGRLNSVRALLIGAGGVIGLATALA